MHRLHKDTLDEAGRKALMAEYWAKSRDNARTPMQWNASPQAGFTAGSTPWMRVHDNYPSVNAAKQVADQDSAYHTWRRVLAARKAHTDIFVYGDFELVDEPNDKVFAYKRTAAGGKGVALVVCNFSKEEVKWESGLKAKEVVITTRGKTVEGANGVVTLAPCEALAVLL